MECGRFAEALTGQEPIGFTWIVILAFLRLSTSQVTFPSPFRIDTATEVVDGWLAEPNAVVLEPRQGHLSWVRELLAATGSGGNHRAHRAGRPGSCRFGQQFAGHR